MDVDLIIGLNIAATFVFGLTGGLEAVRARLDLFGIIVLAAVVGLTGGITRDLMIGVPPETFRDGRYLAAVGAAGVACCVAAPTLERVPRAVLFFDAVGLSLFCVAGATKALAFDLGAIQAVILGVITGIGGGMLRDVLLRQVPVVLRSDLYAVPALVGAGIVAVAHALGSDHEGFAVLGAAACLAIRLVGLRYQIEVPTARGADGGGDPGDPSERP